MNDTKAQKKSLNLIYIAIMIGLTFIALFGMFYVKSHGAVNAFSEESNYAIKSIVVLALLVGIPVSHLFYHKKIKHINEEWPLINKLRHFRTAFIVRIVMLEAIAVLSIVAYLLNADSSFLYMFGVVFVLFIIHAPTKNRITTDLQLTEEEQQLL